MNEEKIDFMLDNQRLIMKALRGSFNHDELKTRENLILIKLKPVEEQSLPEKTKDALEKKE